MPPVSKPNMRVPTAMRPDWMGRSLWAFGLLLVALGLFFLVDPFGNNAGSANVVTAPTPVSAQSPDAGLSTQPIETICVGQRVAGKNPTGAFDDSLGDVNPATWRHLKLRMTKSDGGRLELELLRPTWWVEAHDARTGGTIGLDLPELGAQGVAEVFSIGDCPELSPGEGHVVTGTFAHSSTDVVDLSVVGLTEPIGVTANHPIWSVDREQFVEAGKFHPGERMRSFSGDTVRVISLLPRPGPQLVYNLEVHGEHEYSVSSLGLLAHNSCAPRSGNPDILVLGRGNPNQLSYVADAVDGRVINNPALSGNPRQLWKHIYGEMRKADEIVQVLDDIPTTTLGGRGSGEWARAEKIFIDSMKALRKKRTTIYRSDLGL